MNDRRETKKFSRSAGRLGGRERMKQESRPPHRRATVCVCSAYHVVHKSCGVITARPHDGITNGRAIIRDSLLFRKRNGA